MAGTILKVKHRKKKARSREKQQNNLKLFHLLVPNIEARRRQVSFKKKTNILFHSPPKTVGMLDPLNRLQVSKY